MISLVSALYISVLKELRKDSNILIVNLAVADLIVCGIVDPFSLVGKLYEIKKDEVKPQREL